ncbi:MAG: zinc-binding alcohol dehydrogenase [Anaerolineales bacterium]
MNARGPYFTAPRQVSVRSIPLPSPTTGQVLVETICSAVSPGTEMLIYRGQFPQDLSEACDTLSSDLHYPLTYGYACVGRVVEIGKGVDSCLEGKLVFAFHPHASHFIICADDLLSLPDGMEPETACFLPNMETAVNLAQDAAPILGERVLVFGQGIVGLLTAALLAEFPLASLVTCDCLPLRRKASRSLGVSAALDPRAPHFQEQARQLLPSGADLTLELSGAPEALNDAIALTGFGGRIVIGSWYGEKCAALNLGGTFHRSRIRLIASQVSTIAPELSARWNKARRFEVAWEALERIRPAHWITHRFPLEQAAEAYRLLDERPDEAILVVFVYG